MAAFNWIEFEAECPVCSEESVIWAQCHIAASFDGDSQGRFSGNTYRIGQVMPWWTGGAASKSWSEGALRVSDKDEGFQECCYANCLAHNDALYAIVELDGTRRIKVVKVGPEEQWPPDYPK